MKKLIQSLLLGLIAMTIITGCQKEESEFIDETNEETITADSTLGLLLTRSSQNAGDLDDIIDGSDCLEVNLPITVFANGQKVLIEDEDDIDIVEDIFDQFSNDEDVLEIIFPITVTLADFTTLTINSQEELNQVIAACESDFDDSIECITFEYPITFFTFNSDNEQTGTVTINSDVELFLFLSDLDDDEDFISLQFPVSVVANGETIEVNNNEELLMVFSETDCDNDSIDVSEAEENLISGSWYITYFFDDFDETDDFAGYEFTFNQDNTALADNGTTTVNGTWNFDNDDSGTDLELFFGENNPFDELDEDWEIIEITDEIIRLKDISGGDGSTDFLTFEREPNSTGNGNNANMLIETLVDGTWFVTLYNDDGEIETCDYVDYEFVFSANGTVVAESTMDVVNGNWTVQNDDSGLDVVLNFAIDNDDDPFEDLNDDWDVEEYSPTNVNLFDVSGGNGGTDILHFGREPAQGCGSTGNLEEFNQNLITGNWFVTEYTDDGDIETCDYDGYEFIFMTNGTVVAENDTNTVNGTWLSQGGSSGIDLILNFEFTGSNDPFEDLNDDWDVQEFDTNVIRLFDVSGGGGGTDTLVFGRAPAPDCTGTGGNAQELTEIMEQGTWIVSLYSEDNVNQTSNYNGYEITWNTNGTAVATNGTNAFNGTWSITGSGDSLDFTMDFGTTAPFDEFEDDWDVISYSETQVELIDVSGGGGGTDRLSFEKL